MSKDILQLLFNSKTRVKILKFLFRNSALSFSLKELAVHVQEKPSEVRKEVGDLIIAGLIKVKK